MRQACHGKHGTEACRAEVQKLGEGRTRTQSSRCDGDSVSESARDCHKSGGGGPCCCAAWEASPCASDDISESIAVVCAAQHARISSVMALCSMLFMDKRTHLLGILSQGVGAHEAECLLEVPRLQRSPGHQDRALRVLFRKGGQLSDDHSYKKSTRGAFWQRRRHCGARMQRYVSAAGRTDAMSVRLVELTSQREIQQLTERHQQMAGGMHVWRTSTMSSSCNHGSVTPSARRVLKTSIFGAENLVQNLGFSSRSLASPQQPRQCIHQDAHDDADSQGAGRRATACRCWRAAGTPRGH